MPRAKAFCRNKPSDRIDDFLYGRHSPASHSDTDRKSLYVERELAHFDAKVGGTVDYQTTKMDFADYLKQGRQTARHRELWRLLRS